jgi:hypothetical protein
MKKLLFVLLFAALPLSANAGSPCAAIMCMSDTNPPKECKSEIDNYFGIREYKHGKFSPSRTSAARKKKVEDKCPDARRSDVERIHAKYSTLYGNPFKF